jgi:hypothetical protein
MSFFAGNTQLGSSFDVVGLRNTKIASLQTVTVHRQSSESVSQSRLVVTECDHQPEGDRALSARSRILKLNMRTTVAP